jgi:hypothetical protein
VRRWRLAALVVAGGLASACAGPQVDAEAPWPYSEVRPDCGGGDKIFVLAAQAVPSATLLPCLDDLLSGWDYSGSETINGRFSFWLDSDRAGIRSVEVTLVPDCDVSNAVEVNPGVDEAGTRRFEDPLSLEPAFAANRFYTFPGGCVRVAYRFGVAESTLVLEADQAIGFRPRQEIVDRVAAEGLVLCGAGAPECPGGE